MRIACSPLVPLRCFAGFRVIAFLWMVSVIVYDWTQHDWTLDPPLVFLTEWGFVAACSYMGLATVSSVALLADKMADVKGSQMEECLGSGQATEEETGSVISGEEEGGFMWVTSVTFHIALVLEPCIVIGYWTLVYPVKATCDFPVCITVHCIGAVVVLLDAGLNQLPLLLPRLCYPLGYTALWLASQFAWVYTDHQPDYEVLTLKDPKSILVAGGGIVLLILMFFFLRCLLDKCRYEQGSCRCIDFLNPYKW